MGVFLGLAGAYLLTGFLTALLFEVAPTDPRTLLEATLTLAVVGSLASYLPAAAPPRSTP